MVNTHIYHLDSSYILLYLLYDTTFTIFTITVYTHISILYPSLYLCLRIIIAAFYIIAKGCKQCRRVKSMTVVHPYSGILCSS